MSGCELPAPPHLFRAGSVHPPPRNHAAMSLATRIAVPLLALAVLMAPAPCRADAAADTAAALQAQIRAWIAGLASPAVDLGGHEVQVTPAGDGFRFDLPVAGAVGDTGWRLTGDPVTALAKPLDGGLWAIELLRLPTPLRADQPAMRGAGPGSWVLTLAGQEISGVFDPTLATASGFTAALRGYELRARSGDGTQTLHLDRTTWHGGWEPTGEGRATVAGEGQGEHLSIVTDSADGSGRAIIAADRIRGSGRVEGVAFDRLGAALRGLAGPVPADRAGLRELVFLLRDLLGGARQETTLEGVRLDIGGQRGSLASLTIGGRAAAIDGLLDLSVRLSLEGIDSPLFPPGPLRDYLPRRLALAPHLSGIPVDALVSLLLRAIDGGDPETLRAEALELIGKAPLKAGLDDLVLDLGPAVLKASGTMTVVGPDDIAGTAHIVATGLDALIRRAAAAPELQVATPFLLLLKGVGTQAGDATTWNVTYGQGHAEVNGTDLSALLMVPLAAPERPRGHRP